MVKERKPDLILMDVAMPGFKRARSDGARLKEVSRCQVIILSMYANEEYVREAIMPEQPAIW